MLQASIKCLILYNLNLELVRHTVYIYIYILLFQDEEYYYYSIVNVQDLTVDTEPTPLGPNKEGPLMFKTAESDSSRWETAYFILKYDNLNLEML